MARKPKQPRPQQAACIMCHRVTSDLYWTTDIPFCARCYEDEHRRAVRDESDRWDQERLHRVKARMVF